jgi:hypothetical protein
MGRIPSDLQRQVGQENSTWGNLLELDVPMEVESVTAFDWFRYAAHHFPNARFIGKGEMNTYVYADSLLAAVRQVPEGIRNVYGGVAQDYYKCAGMHLGPWPIDMEKCPKGWMYMQGDLYFLSHDLVQWMGESSNEIVQANANDGREDVQVGKCLRQSKFSLIYMD